MAWKGCTKSLVHTFAPTCASPGLSPFLSPILSACTIPTNSEHSIPQSSSRLGAVTSPQQQAPSQHSSFLLTPLQHSWWQISRATKSSVPHTAQCLPCRLPCPSSAVGSCQITYCSTTSKSQAGAVHSQSRDPHSTQVLTPEPL